jgi:hypothetical protein
VVEHPPAPREAGEKLAFIALLKPRQSIPPLKYVSLEAAREKTTQRAK